MTDAPRTRLEQLLMKERLDTTDFLRRFKHTAAALAAESPASEKPAVVSWSQARRWIKGEVKDLPYRASCRVLERMFERYGSTAEELFGPPIADHGSALVAHLPRTADPRPPSLPVSSVPLLAAETANADEIEGLTSMAAAESAAFSERAEQSNIGPHTLEQFHDDLTRIVSVYPNRPIYPLLVELRALASRAFALLDGRQPPARSRDLYLIAGTLCAVEANACFDLGSIHAAKTLARSAFMCGEMAEHHGLRAWVRGLQALIAYWDHEYEVAADLAERAYHQYSPETGTARVRLAATEARARGRLRDEQGTMDALRRAEQAREQVRGEDLPGGMMAFPPGKQAYSAASAYLWLGGDANFRQAERLAETSLELYLADPPERRRLGEMSLARLDLATARLSRDDLDGADEQIRDVLRTSTQRRVESTARRLRQISTQLDRPRYQTSTLATTIRDNILDVTTIGGMKSLDAGRES
ncbi:hypothetical protein ACWDSJ_28060 [Nocardia sp. NPDC003482]